MEIIRFGLGGRLHFVGQSVFCKMQLLCKI